MITPITHNDTNEYIETLKNGIATCGHKAHPFHKTKPRHKLDYLLNQIENNCSLCLFPITLANRNIAIINNCGHIFHYQLCLETYLENDNYDCCICRQKISTIDIHNSINDFIINECNICDQTLCYNNEYTNTTYIREEISLDEIMKSLENILNNLESVLLPIIQFKNDIVEIKKALTTFKNEISKITKLYDKENKIIELNKKIKDNIIIYNNRQERTKRFHLLGKYLEKIICNQKDANSLDILWCLVSNIYYMIMS